MPMPRAGRITSAGWRKSPPARIPVPIGDRAARAIRREAHSPLCVRLIICVASLDPTPGSFLALRVDRLAALEHGDESLDLLLPSGLGLHIMRAKRQRE